jgi:hypothetical protein
VDDVARSRRLLLIGVLAAAAVACGAGEAGPVGVSPPRAVERSARSSDGGDGGDDLASDLDGHVFHASPLSRISDRFLSQGHAQRFDAIVWANDAARHAGDGDAGSDFSEGAVFVEEAIERSEGDAGVAGLLAMEKRAGTWRFSAVQPGGEVVTDARAGACVTCHREAPRDFVFRTPQTQSSSAAASAPITATAPTPVATAAATYDARSAGSAAPPSRR